MRTDKHHHYLPTAGIMIVLIVFLAGACVAAPPPVPTPASSSEAITKAIAFLKHNYNPDVGLIRESPETAPNRYWLTTDNWLAVRALRAAGEDKLADTIQATIAEYDPSGRDLLHGIVEVLEGEDIEWPPSTECKDPIKKPIYVERRNTEDIMHDWQEYADLAFYGALDAYHEGDHATAKERYRQALKLFDGIGFKDKAFADKNRYATYKIALALYVADVLNIAPEPALMNVLLSKQADNGGFTSLYDTTGTPVADANTETTSLAIWALVHSVH